VELKVERIEGLYGRASTVRNGPARTDGRNWARAPPGWFQNGKKLFSRPEMGYSMQAVDSRSNNLEFHLIAGSILGIEPSDGFRGDVRELGRKSFPYQELKISLLVWHVACKKGRETRYLRPEMGSAGENGREGCVV
jgi:hypothetical protein